jgi:hypothetical protein
MTNLRACAPPTLGESRCVPFSYTIDEQGMIVQTCPEWDALVDQFEQLGPRSGDILGTSFLDHMGSPDLRQIYRELVARTRMTGKTLRFPFRCDTPTQTSPTRSKRTMAVRTRCTLWGHRPVG